MKVFISHSMEDAEYLNGIVNRLKRSNIQFLIAEHYLSLRDTISDKIRSMIEESHIGLVILTEHGMNSNFVQQEIGYLDAKKKPTLFVVAEDETQKLSGFAYGRDYIQILKVNPNDSIDRIENRLLQFLEEHINKKLANIAKWAFIAIIAISLVPTKDE